MIYSVVSAIIPHTTNFVSLFCFFLFLLRRLKLAFSMTGTRKPTVSFETRKVKSKVFSYIFIRISKLANFFFLLFIRPQKSLKVHPLHVVIILPVEQRKG